MKVLVVDDYADVADSMALLLQAYGHEVRTAYSGAAAVTAGSVWTPDLILMDIQLGAEDGCEVAQTMRADPTLSQCRIVAMSGAELGPPAERAAQFAAVLMKPIGSDALRTLLSDESGPAA